MKKGLIFSLLLFLSVYFLARVNIYECRARITKEGVHVTASNLPPAVIKAIAGEFKGVFADYILLKAASFIGGTARLTPEDWEGIAILCKQTMDLDPYFKQTYCLIQATLPWEAEKVDLTVKLLKKSMQHRSWDWVPGFFIGFDYFYFKKDNLQASKYIMEASKVPDAPIPLATLGARLAQKAEQTQTAIGFLKTMLSKTDNEKTKELLETRIKALTGALILEKAVKFFKNKYGRIPPALEDLLSKGILTSLPENPYGDNYFYNPETGRIDFFKEKSREKAKRITENLEENP